MNKTPDPIPEIPLDVSMAVHDLFAKLKLAHDSPSLELVEKIVTAAKLIEPLGFTATVYRKHKAVGITNNIFLRRKDDVDPSRIPVERTTGNGSDSRSDEEVDPLSRVEGKALAVALPRCDGYISNLRSIICDQPGTVECCGTTRCASCHQHHRAETHL